MSQMLQYNYARIDSVTGQCLGCFTCSYEIPIPNEYIEVPYATDDYIDKYYNVENGLWYHDSEFTQLWEECPSHNT